MEFFVPVLDSEKNLGGVGFVRRRNLDRLETTLQRPIFLDGFAVFARSCGADALNLAPRQRWLQNVGSIQRAFGRTGAHQSVKLINEDDAVLRFHQFFHDGLEPLFELAAIFGSGDDQ